MVFFLLIITAFITSKQSDIKIRVLARQANMNVVRLLFVFLIRSALVSVQNQLRFQFYFLSH